VRALAGLCASDLGDRPQARQLARLAQASFDAQPDVAAYLKAPMLQLDARLRAPMPARLQARAIVGPDAGQGTGRGKSPPAGS
jgi:hypothetical protein